VVQSEKNSYRLHQQETRPVSTTPDSGLVLLKSLKVVGRVVKNG
jgi:hypothetical protein